MYHYTRARSALRFRVLLLLALVSFLVAVLIIFYYNIPSIKTHKAKRIMNRTTKFMQNVRLERCLQLISTKQPVPFAFAFTMAIACMPRRVNDHCSTRKKTSWSQDSVVHVPCPFAGDVFTPLPLIPLCPLSRDAAKRRAQNETG